MGDRLNGVRAKVARAEQHVTRLQSQVVAHVAEHPGLMVGYFEVESQGGAVGLRARFTYKPVPAVLGVTIGDAVHNLRSALDHLAWQVATNPNDSTTFPIEDKAANFDKRRQPVAPGIGGGADPEVRAVIAKFQPWWPKGSLGAAVDHPLRVLRELSNHDKHRMLTGVLHNIDFLAEGSWDLPIGTKLVPHIKTIDAQDGSAEFRLVPIDLDTDMDMNVKWALGTRLRPLDGSPPFDVTLMPALLRILDLIRDEIIPALKGHLLR